MVGSGHDGADRAAICRLLIAVVAGRPLLLRGAACSGGGEVRRSQRDGGCNDWRCIGCNRVEMSKRQYELNRQREKRHSRARFDVRSKPFHTGGGPTPNPDVIM